MLPTIKFLIYSNYVHGANFEFDYLPFNSSEIIHISYITSGHLGDLGFNYEFGFSFYGLGFDFGEINP
jgi:hypothetical protein